MAALSKCGPFIVLQDFKRRHCPGSWVMLSCRAMERPIERLQDILASVRIGRASPGSMMAGAGLVHWKKLSRHAA